MLHNVYFAKRKRERERERERDLRKYSFSLFFFILLFSILYKISLMILYLLPLTLLSNTIRHRCFALEYCILTAACAFALEDLCAASISWPSIIIITTTIVSFVLLGRASRLRGCEAETSLFLSFFGDGIL